MFHLQIGSSPTTYDSRIKNSVYLAPGKFNLPTIILVPRDTGPSYLSETEDDKNDPTKDNEENMSTAEDIIFRPLFRFRQEAHRRADAYNDRRYNSYQSYDSYPRRRYRPRYSDDYY